jgi:Ca2+/Na+ antiporter
MDRDNLEKTIEELFDLAVYIYGATHKPNEIHFDFFFLHLVTSMHAIRIIYAHIHDQQIMENILLQFFYFAMVVYTSQLRPEINEDLINDYEIDEKKNNWDYVIDRTLNTKFINDSHGVKVIRALRDADKVYGNKNNFYLKTAVKTVDHVDYDRVWIGRETDQRQLNVLKRL